MKMKISNILSIVLGAIAISGLWSCSAENPFDSDGQGIVQLRTVVNSITTRADDDTDTESSLEEKCVVYISGEDGLVYQKKGLNNVDPQITLKAGSYVAEAWTGDSVTASWDKKFYRGYQTFEVTKGSTSNIVLNCRIANVVASIDPSTINPDLMKDDYSISIKNTRGELVFIKDNIDKKAYFMMPNGDDKLLYEIKGTKSDGKPFSQNGEINVERAHHYIFSLQYNPDSSDSQMGYVFIKINIKDEEIIDENIHVITKPSISGIDFDIEQKLKFINDEDIPEEGISVKICGNRLNDAILKPVNDCKWDEILGLDDTNKNIIPGDEINFAQLSGDDPIMLLCKEKGLEYKSQYNENTKIETSFFNFSKGLFLRLAKSEKLYELEIRVSDSHNQESTASLRIARSETAAIDDPIEIMPIASDDRLSIKANSAYLTFSLAQTYEGTPGVEYSKANEDNWTFVAAPIPAGIASTRSDDDNAEKIKLTGLEEGTTYKYRACCGDFRSEDIFTFTTESKFIIPNASMEDWSNFSESSKVLLPAADGVRTFWDSGNHGSATMNKTLTQGTDKMAHSGVKSAELKSQFVGIASIGKFAAGNLFAGTYKETKGTNGVIEFGRSYNGSHPSALSLWANYRPGIADSKGKNDAYIKQGDTDQSQIYIAISTDPVIVDTSNSATLFDPDALEILAYGEITWTENFGPDGGLQQVTIPLKYNDRAQTKEAKYLIIVCSASKYGDYFCGGEGSTMYLDDFELIYE